jgi:hypothetical protein
MAGQGNGGQLYEEIRETWRLLTLPGLHFLSKIHQVRGIRGRGKRYRSCSAQTMAHALGNSASRGYSGIPTSLSLANFVALRHYQRHLLEFALSVSSFKIFQSTLIARPRRARGEIAIFVRSTLWKSKQGPGPDRFWFQGDSWLSIAGTSFSPGTSK